MLRHFDDPQTAIGLAPGIEGMSLLPATASRLAAAKIIIGQEARRLDRGRVYHLNARLTRLATDQRREARDLPVTWDRIPTTSGFMGFERPIGGTPDQPIVAVSWGPWSRAGNRTPTPARGRRPPPWPGPRGCTATSTPTPGTSRPTSTGWSPDPTRSAKT